MFVKQGHPAVAWLYHPKGPVGGGFLPANHWGRENAGEAPKMGWESAQIGGNRDAKNRAATATRFSHVSVYALLVLCQFL